MMTGDFKIAGFFINNFQKKFVKIKKGAIFAARFAREWKVFRA